MEIDIEEIEGVCIAYIVSEDIEISTVQEALDLMANCSYRGADKIVIFAYNLTADFFDLKTGLAGEILQKFSNYRISISIIGDFSKYESKSFQAFVYESNKGTSVNFVSTVQEARKRWKV